MLFSREQLAQLASTNGYSINTLISQQKRLERFQSKKLKLRQQMKDVVSSKKGELSGGSSLLMGRINTSMLKEFGFDNINDLIAEYDENEKNIKDVKMKVSKEDNKIQSSLEILKGIDINKDMKDQVTQAVLLDSDLAEVRNNSQEILLMLSQSKTSEDVLSVAKGQIDANELKIKNYINANKLNNAKLISDLETKIENGNRNDEKLNERLSNMTKQKENMTYLQKINNKLSNLSTNNKNAVIITAFSSFFALGLFSALKPKNKSKQNKD